LFFHFGKHRTLNFQRSTFKERPVRGRKFPTLAAGS
jgi:hypothetical protein